MLRKALRFVPFAVLSLSLAHANSTNVGKHRDRPQLSDWVFVSGIAPSMAPAFSLALSPDNWLGGTGNWSNGADWSAGLPGQGSNVTINTGNDYVTLDTSASINSLTLGGSSGSSTLIDPVGNGYTINIAGALTIGQSGTLTLGTQSSGDNVSANANSSNAGNIILGNFSQLQINANFTNSGFIQFNSFNGDGGAFITVTGNFTNSGTISDQNYPTQDSLTVVGSLTNTGTIGDVSGGPNVFVSGSMTNSGSFAPTEFNVNGTFTNTAGGGVATYLNGGQVGSLNNAGSISLYSGGLLVNGDASNTGQIIVANDGFLFGGESLDVEGTLTNGATGQISAGTGFSEDFSAVSASNLVNSGTIQLQGAGGLYVTSSVTNSGMITTSNPGDNEIIVGGTFTNNVGAVFQLLGTGDTATMTNLVNLGQISVGDGATLTVPVSANAAGNALAGFLNAGNVLIQQGGEISSFGKYTQTTGQTTVDGHLAGIINFAGGSVYGNSGTISGSITSNASINVGDEPLTVGQLTFAGNYTQGANGNLTFDIASQNQYDQVTITGQAHLNGLMTVDLLHGYIPQIGNLFEIMTFANESGTFSNVVGLPIDNQEHFVLEYNSTNLTLDVVAGQLAGITSVKLGSGNSISYEPFIQTADSGSGYQLAINEAPSQTTPEPGTLLLCGSGLASIVGFRRACRM